MKPNISFLFRILVCLVVFSNLLRRTDGAQPALLPHEIPAFLKKVEPKAAAQAQPAVPAEAPTYSTTPDGFLRSVSAPPGRHFPPEPGAAAKAAHETAQKFLQNHARLFGMSSPAVDFVHVRTKSAHNRTYVRMQQAFRGVPLVAAEVVVQLNEQSGVEAVLCDLEPKTQSLDTGQVPTTPTLTSAEAAIQAKAAFAAQVGALEVRTGPAQLAIFAPSVLDEPGDLQLIWDMPVFTEDRSVLNVRVLVDALQGTIVRVWTLNPTALNREVSDKNNLMNAAAVVRRTEGQGPSGITEVDNAYTFLGDTYDFYLNHHGRDSYNGFGAQINMTVRYCDPAKACPWVNAQAGPPIIFGDGFAVDDVVAHEFTHNVTANESRLIYTNASGAINESFSDVWGEFVDLTNGRGDDSDSVRWLIGEELSPSVTCTPSGNANSKPIRSMQYPTNFCDPDRMNSPLYQPPSNTFDNGGVHKNSGVNNKLCYLLTDGDTFNGQTITALNINNVSALYYEVQANLLTSGAGWPELYNALTQATVNLGWGTRARNNLYRACLAVEIATGGSDLYVDQASSCLFPVGLPTCSGFAGPFVTVGQGIGSARPGDIIHVRTGSYNEPATINKILSIQAYDGPVTIGR